MNKPTTQPYSLLPQSLELLEIVFDTIPMGIVVYSEDGITRTHVNQSFCDFIGYSRQEILTETYGKLTVEDDLDESLDSRQKLRSGEVDHYVLKKRYRHKKGHIVWGEVESTVLRDTDGGTLNYVSFVRDITEDKEHQEALQASEKRFKTLIDNSNQGIMLHRDSKALYANNAFVELYGYDSEQEILDLDSTRELIATETADPAHYTIFDGDEEESNIEYIGVKKDGTRFWVQRRSFLIDWEGKPTVCTARIDISERKKAEEALVELASTDSLTGAENRRGFFDKGENELRRATRYNRPISILAMDLDHFKKVNDTHGHAVGDQILRLFADVCRKVFREQDLLGRMGGEEFAVLLPEDNLAAAHTAAERLRVACEGIRLNMGKDELRITVSIGVIECGMIPENLEQALDRADKALYEAKKAGRNRVVVQKG
jgi:diguanylate cyclase